MSFKILLHRNVAKFLRQFTDQEKINLIERLKQLEYFPQVKLDIVKIAGEKDTFRLRMGKYRALFKVYNKERIIVVVKTDLRSRIYR